MGRAGRRSALLHQPVSGPCVAGGEHPFPLPSQEFCLCRTLCLSGVRLLHFGAALWIWTHDTPSRAVCCSPCSSLVLKGQAEAQGFWGGEDRGRLVAWKQERK